MKNSIFFIALAALFVGYGIALPAAPDEARPFIGIRIDAHPLPELLTKHLQLKPEQGLVIKNVQKGSPADKAGLERDDIIIEFQNKPVFDYNSFVDAIHDAGVGARVKLTIIHLGKKREVIFKLGKYKPGLEWKYPFEPDEIQSWRPGRMFRLQPGDKNWIEIPWNQMPHLDKKGTKLFKEQYLFNYQDGDKHYEIEITGNPNDKNSEITVKIDNKEYKTTIGEINELPQAYRKAAENAIENAKKTAHAQVPDFNGEAPWFSIPAPDLDQPPAKAHEKFFQKFEKEMQELRQRIEEMENKWRHQEKSRSGEPEKL